MKTYWQDCGLGTLLHPVSHASVTTRVVELPRFGRIGEWYDCSNTPDENFKAILAAPNLIEAGQQAVEALMNVPFVGDVYDQQHSDTQLQAAVALQDIIKEVVGPKYEIQFTRGLPSRRL